MYVCICSAVTDGQIRESVSKGARSMRDLQLSLNVGACCGRCTDCARRVFTSALIEVGMPDLTPKAA